MCVCVCQLTESEGGGGVEAGRGFNLYMCESRVRNFRQKINSAEGGTGNSQNFVPNHFAEEKNARNSVLWNKK